MRIKSICKGVILLMGYGIKTKVENDDVSMVRHGRMVVRLIDYRS